MERPGKDSRVVHPRDLRSLLRRQKPNSGLTTDAWLMGVPRFLLFFVVVGLTLQLANRVVPAWNAPGWFGILIAGAAALVAYIVTDRVLVVFDNLRVRA